MSVAIETQSLSLGPDAPRRFASILFAETRRFAFANGCGDMRTDLVRVGDEGLRIGRVVSTGHEIDLTESGLASFLAPRRGRLDIDQGRRTWRAEAGEMLGFRPGARRTRVCANGGNRFEAHLVMLPDARLVALRESALGSGAAIGPDGALMAGSASRRLGAYVAFLFDSVFGRDAAGVGPSALARMAALLDDLVADAAAGWGFGPPDRAAAARRVRMAEEIMHARSDEALALHAVAREVGVGLRSLQLAFRAVRGEEPRAILTRMRLERARARLAAAQDGETVTKIALDCGFTHLGRFAAAYRRAFGEPPSATLGRPR